MDQPFDFSGRTVFVAGGTSGINLGIAEAFAAAGAKVAVLGRSAERLKEAEQRLKTHGGAVLGFSADVRNAEATAAALKSAHDEFDLVARHLLEVPGGPFGLGLLDAVLPRRHEIPPDVPRAVHRGAAEDGQMRVG